MSALGAGIATFSAAGVISSTATTGTGSVVQAASPTITGTLTAATVNTSETITVDVASGTALDLKRANSVNGRLSIDFANAYSNMHSLNRFDLIAGGAGGVTLAAAGTSWGSLSDERMKDIIEPITDAVSKIGSFRAVIGKYKTDTEGTRRSFLIAQDVQKVFPEAVNDADSDKLILMYSEVIPLLVAAIKEQQSQIEALSIQCLRKQNAIN